MKPHRGTLILILGILGITFCAPLGIAAWIMGSGDIKEMDAGKMDASGKSLTNAGKVCGIIGTVVTIIAVIFAMLGFMVAMLTTIHRTQ
jgi:hypothetical protein